VTNFISSKILLPRKTADMKAFVKTTKMEANKQFSQGPLSVTNEIVIDPNNKITLNKDNEDWINLRYKIVRSRWKKVPIMQDKVIGAVQIDRIIKEPPSSFLTARPTVQDGRQESAPSKRQKYKVVSQDRGQISSSGVLPKTQGKPQAITQAKTDRIDGGTKPTDAGEQPVRTSLKPANAGALTKLRDKVLKVVTAMKLKQAGEERVARVSQNAERSVSQANYTLASPERDNKRPEVRLRARRGSRRMSSGSAVSFHSRMSSFADLNEKGAKPTKKSIKAMPARAQQPEQDKSKGDRDDSMSSSSSPSKRSEESGVRMNYENTPKVILLNQTLGDTPEYGKTVTNKYNRDGEGLLRRLKAKAKGNKIDFQTEILENSEYRHVKF
jgi:hypothetical protein